jgi:hypothetical protein
LVFACIANSFAQLNERSNILLSIIQARPRLSKVLKDIRVNYINSQWVKHENTQHKPIQCVPTFSVTSAKLIALIKLSVRFIAQDNRALHLN